MKKNGKEKLLPGLDMNHQQLFFLNFAQVFHMLDGRLRKSLCYSLTAGWEEQADFLVLLRAVRAAKLSSVLYKVVKVKS